MTGTRKCRRCNGTGLYTSATIHGECFGCGGRGTVLVGETKRAAEAAWASEMAARSALMGAAKAKDEALPRRERHFYRDLANLEYNDPAAFRALLEGA